jgi:uncharacterized protein with PIN domain
MVATADDTGGGHTKFIADVMVGKLARWLRVLGLDVAYSNAFIDDEVVRLAEAEDRIILTRDTGLVARRPAKRCLLIESDDYKEQLRQVVQTFDLKDFKIFSRCLECNTRLRDVDKEEVFEKVPPYVYLTQNRFAQCASCGRIYWHGTHADEMWKRIGILS